MKNSYLFKLIQLLYGELFNKDNSKENNENMFKNTIKNFIYTLFNIFKKKNPQLSTNSISHFENDISHSKILKELKDGISDKILLKKEIVNKILNGIEGFEFQINRTKKKHIKRQTKL